MAALSSVVLIVPEAPLSPNFLHHLVIHLFLGFGEPATPVPHPLYLG